MTEMKVAHRGISLSLNQQSLACVIEAKGVCWSWAADYQPKIVFSDGEVLFTEAAEQSHRLWKTGVGEGIISSYRGFSFHGAPIGLELDTIVWIESITGEVYFELIPVAEGNERIQAVYWPGPMAFEENKRSWYTLLNLMQGLLLPNNWPNEVREIPFDGMMGSTAAYMPWWGQIRPEGGYLALCREFWDAAYAVEHPANGPYSHVSIKWLPSQGKLCYRRTMRYTFYQKCDHNDLCKTYRQYAKENGLLVTLREKAVRLPGIGELIGSAIVHKGIKDHVSPDSAYYNKEDPASNDKLTTFAVRAAQMEALHEAGLKKAYLHLDGWGQPGYDNQHPDYLPACKEAGGWTGLRTLSEKMQQLGFLFGIHDQYRDYYFDAATFDREFALHDPDGQIPEFARWAGGRQTYMCATQAPFYVRRNFQTLLGEGVHLDCTYLDVFTCNEGDECTHVWHRMTRRECFGYRRACFAYLASLNILPSSEEVTDWSIPDLVFAHYGPHDFALWPNKPRRGIPVPLFNLVYHDCVLLPWQMNHKAGGEDEMLYALLNGGAPYLDCELEGEALQAELGRCRIVSGLQERVATLEMTRHELLDDTGRCQCSWFADNTSVTVDFDRGTYEIGG